MRVPSFARRGHWVGPLIAVTIVAASWMLLRAPHPVTEPEEKAERFQLMQQHGISELDAAFRVAEKIDRARGIEPLVLDSLA